MICRKARDNGYGAMDHALAPRVGLIGPEKAQTTRTESNTALPSIAMPNGTITTAGRSIHSYASTIRVPVHEVANV